MDSLPGLIKNIPLSDKTWLGVGGPADYFIQLDDTEIIPRVHLFCQKEGIPIFILGDGSNVVISDEGFKGLVLKLTTDQITILSESQNEIIVRGDAGINWDKFVSTCVESGWWGLENLSLIPGTVGASPVQNVGAYGQECKNVIVNVNAFDRKTGRFVEIRNADCNFGFRSSIFNTTAKDRFIITSVDFKLSKVAKPILTRPEVKREVERLSPAPEILQSTIRQVVVGFRTNGKALPNESRFGSAGTFFRTTVVSGSVLALTFFRSFFKLGPKSALITLIFAWKYRDKSGFRIPSRRLIDACKLGSSTINSVSLHRFNSAVLITDKQGEPTSKDIICLIKHVRDSVYQKTGFHVPIEPTLIGFSSEELASIFRQENKD